MALIFLTVFQGVLIWSWAREERMGYYWQLGGITIRCPVLHYCWNLKKQIKYKIAGAIALAISCIGCIHIPLPPDHNIPLIRIPGQGIFYAMRFCLLSYTSNWISVWWWLMLLNDLRSNLKNFSPGWNTNSFFFYLNK